MTDDDARGLVATRKPRPPFTLLVAPYVAPDASEAPDNTPVVPPAVVNPITGELVPIQDSDALRDWVVDVKEFEAALDIAKRVVGKEIIAGMDRRIRHTIHHRGMKIEAPADKEQTTYPDGRKVYELLERLVKEGKIDPRVVGECIDIKPVQYVPKIAGLKRLAKDKAIARRLKRLEKRGDRNRTLKVGR